MFDLERLHVIAAPTVEPVTLAECKAWLRVTASSNDALISRLARSAREQAEAFMDRSIITQTLRLDRPCFGSRMFLPRGRAISVTSVKYVDTLGVEQPLAAANYDLDNPTHGASYINRGWEVVWPTLRGVPDAVRVTYVAGFDPAGSPLDLAAGVPEQIRTAILKLLQCSYDDLKAEDKAALRADAFNDLSPYRIASF